MSQQTTTINPNEIINRIKEAKSKRIKIYPQHVVRASEVGHPCEKYLVLSITNWEDKIPHTAEVEFIFEGGRLVEDLAIKDFEDAGFKIYRPEPDKGIAESKPRITGHIDIRVDFGDGKIYTGEIKGLNVYDWQKLNSIEDFHKSKKSWIKKYPAQLMTYMYIKGEEKGFFYLKSIPRFQPKFIWVDLDLDYMESILQKTERVEKHVQDGTFPDGVNDYDICQYCSFLHICLPTIRQEGIQFIDDEDLEQKLLRREELSPFVKEYNEIDRDIKKSITEKDKVFIGDFVITGGWVDRKGHTVEASQYWKPKINRLNPETVQKAQE